MLSHCPVCVLANGEHFAYETIGSPNFGSIYIISTDGRPMTNGSEYIQSPVAYLKLMRQKMKRGRDGDGHCDYLKSRDKHEMTYFAIPLIKFVVIKQQKKERLRPLQLPRALARDQPSIGESYWTGSQCRKLRLVTSKIYKRSMRNSAQNRIQLNKRTKRNYTWLTT